MADFAERLKFLRNRKNITQQGLADDIGVSRTAIAGYEKLDKQPNFEVLIKMAKYFNVTTDYLLGISENEIEQDSKQYFAEKIDSLFKESGKYSNGGFSGSESFASYLYKITMKSFDYGIHYPVAEAAGAIQWCFLKLFDCIDKANDAFDNIDDIAGLDKNKLKSDSLRSNAFDLAYEAHSAIEELVNYCCHLMEEDGLHDCSKQLKFDPRNGRLL